MDSIQSSGYPGDSAILQKVRDIREMALLEGMLKTPTLNIYQTYITEYPNGKFISQINTAENKRLYQIVKSNPTSANFKAFLITPTCRNSSRIKRHASIQTTFRKFFAPFICIIRFSVVQGKYDIIQPPGEILIRKRPRNSHGEYW